MLEREALSWNPNSRVIAFYLPQYHPVPENDEWWGTGFTDWTNVVTARPLFPGHYQPHIPADLGFYDLRVPEVRQAQAELARAHSIYGFCYYHYWFHGKHLLERPFNEVLSSGKPDFPFCLCWANENWTRVWDGRNEKVLIEQAYSEQDDRRHIRWLVQAFQDRRYIRVEDRPLLLVYRAARMPDPLKTTAIWREEAQKMGMEDIYLCRVESAAGEHGDPKLIGFDAAVEFQPDWAYLASAFRRKIWFLAKKLGLPGMIYSYSSFVERMCSRAVPPYKHFACVTPSWDNTPRRRSGAAILWNSTPYLYERWLRTVLGRSASNRTEENLIFINAWNEWGEGNHLEPCQKWGRAYLEATRRAIVDLGEG